MAVRQEAAVGQGRLSGIFWACHKVCAPPLYVAGALAGTAAGVGAVLASTAAGVGAVLVSPLLGRRGKAPSIPLVVEDGGVTLSSETECKSPPPTQPDPTPASGLNEGPATPEPTSGGSLTAAVARAAATPASPNGSEARAPADVPLPTALAPPADADADTEVDAAVDEAPAMAAAAAPLETAPAKAAAVETAPAMAAVVEEAPATAAPVEDAPAVVAAAAPQRQSVPDLVAATLPAALPASPQLPDHFLASDEGQDEIASAVLQLSGGKAGPGPAAGGKADLVSESGASNLSVGSSATGAKSTSRVSVLSGKSGPAQASGGGRRKTGARKGGVR